MPAPWPLARPLPYPMAQAGGPPSRRVGELLVQIYNVYATMFHENMNEYEKILKELLEIEKPYYASFKETMNQYTDVVPKCVQDFLFQFMDSVQTDSP